jgi:hypothetical protein
MAMKFTIGKKIGAGFAVLIVLTSIAFVATVITLTDSKRKTDEVVGQLAPSVAELKELNLMIQRSGTDVTQWMFNSSASDISFRVESGPGYNYYKRISGSEKAIRGSFKGLER